MMRFCWSKWYIRGKGKKAQDQMMCMRIKWYYWENEGGLRKREQSAGSEDVYEVPWTFSYRYFNDGKLNYFGSWNMISLVDWDELDHTISDCVNHDFLSYSEQESIMDLMHITFYISKLLILSRTLYRNNMYPTWSVNERLIGLKVTF